MYNLYWYGIILLIENSSTRYEVRGKYGTLGKSPYWIMDNG